VSHMGEKSPVNVWKCDDYNKLMDCIDWLFT